MYRMMSRICHYISAWENTVAGEVIKAGLATREQERKAAYNAPAQEG